MVEDYSHLIAGEVKPSGILEVHSPYDHSLIARVDTVAEQAVEQALNFYSPGNWSPPFTPVSGSMPPR